MENEVEFSYALVRNIPYSYRSAQLRIFFSQLVETNCFECFHFKHRPEKIVSDNKDNSNNDQLSSLLCNNKPCSSTATFANKKLQQEIRKTSCCIIKLTEQNLKRFIAIYDGRHWLNEKGESLKSSCHITPIKVAASEEVSRNAYKTKAELLQLLSDKHKITKCDLRILPELNPPSVMPHGNVGTSTEYFLDLIRTCKLPASVVGKLGLTFPKLLGKRKYSSVPFKYTSGTYKTDSETSSLDKDSSSITAVQSSVDELSCETNFRFRTTDSSAAKKTKMPDSPLSDKNVDADESEEDDDGGEEWDRHEALHDDPSEQERNKERLYEEELEIVWEKGGPGIVWYTDAAYWKEEEGDFDEQTADDWDVDMGIYYDPEAGDKDARDYVNKRLTDRRRQGLDDAEQLYPNENNVGSFERYTKGMGRSLMERQGWKEGQGLGSKLAGLQSAISAEGQKPYDKSGLGYFGEKINRYSKDQRSRNNKTVSISTVYDDVAHHKDTPDSLLRRADPHIMKYRKIEGTK